MQFAIPSRDKWFNTTAVVMVVYVAIPSIAISLIMFFSFVTKDFKYLYHISVKG